MTRVVKTLFSPLLSWDGTRIVQPDQCSTESQLQSITAAQSIMTEYVVDTGGLILVPGEKYVAFLSANNGFWNATSTLIRVGWQNVDVYPDGESWILDTDNDASLITAAAWENPFGAADFVVALAF